MINMTCSKCGTDRNVRRAWEYADLAELLDIWQVKNEMETFLLCPGCAAEAAGQGSFDTVKIPQLDFLEIGDPDVEP